MGSHTTLDETSAERPNEHYQREVRVPPVSQPGAHTVTTEAACPRDPASGGMWHALKGYKRCIVPAQG